MSQSHNGSPVLQTIQAPLERRVWSGLFPEAYEIIPGLNEVYELQLAFWESLTLRREALVKRGAYFSAINGQPTFHFLLCSGEPLLVHRTSELRRRSFFEANQFKTGYATHGLFPYRGKFHPQMIRALLNVIGVAEGEVVLDPMVGSGTTLVEATLMGIRSIGYDASPFCTFMSQAKLDGLTCDIELLKDTLGRYKFLYNDLSVAAPRIARLPFEADSYGKWRGVTGDPKVDLLLTLCYFDAVGFARRRKNGDRIELFAHLLTKYVQAVEKFQTIRKTLDLAIAKSDVGTVDARSLPLPDESVQGVIFSPPYSVSIDYIENDRSQLAEMGVDMDTLRSQLMIGLRGETPIERVKRYFEDMELVFRELARVLETGRYVVVVVGSNTEQLRKILASDDPEEISIERRLGMLANKHGLNLKAQLERQITGLHNVMRNEHVLFFQKRG